MIENKGEWIKNVYEHSSMSLEQAESAYAIATIYDMSEERAIEILGTKGEKIEHILTILDYIIFET